MKTHGNKGRKLSLEHKNKLSLAKIGKKLSDEHKKKIGRKGHMGYMLGKTQSIETRKKISLANKGKKRTQETILKFTGENSPVWVSDRTKLKTSEKKHLDSRYRDWMFSVKKRDNWKCKILDKKCQGRLEAHHILSWRDYPELRYEIKNGITLCHAHHPRKRAEEKSLSPYFQELVNQEV